MKKTRVRLLSIAILSFFMVALLSACKTSSSSVQVDYKNAEQLETALNNGADVSGKTVKFHADSLHPESRYGYNIWAGEHLNFISSDDPGIKRNDTAIVTITSTEQLDNGSWLVYYDLIESENSADKTDSIKKSSSEGSVTSATESKEQQKSIKNIQIRETGIYVTSSYVWDDTAYVDYIGLVYNPNTEKVAILPKLIATAKNADGSILATDDETGTVIMPGDTIPIMGRLSINSSEIQEGSYVSYEVECKSFQNDSFVYSSARTTDFSISNISEHSNGYRYYVTGEVKSSFAEDVTMLKLVAIFRKDGEIVGAQSTYLDGLNSKQTKAFEIDSLTNFPEHDTVEVVAVPSL